MVMLDKQVCNRVFPSIHISVNFPEKSIRVGIAFPPTFHFYIHHIDHSNLHLGILLHVFMDLVCADRDLIKYNKSLLNIINKIY